jgi:hypothetical protein
VPKGYCTAAQVAAVLGVEATPAFVEAAEARIEAAEDAIDRYTGRAWLVPSPATGERHRAGRDGVVWLDRTPMLAVTAVSARPAQVGGLSTVLVDGTDYELADATDGVLLVRSGVLGQYLSVDYTHENPLPVPPVVAQVCLEMSVRATVASSVGSSSGTAGALAAGIKSYSVGQELQVTFADTAASGSAGAASSGGVTVPADLLGQLAAVRLVRPVFA